MLVVAFVLTSCGWRGIANVPLPGGPGTGPGSYTVYVQMPDTLALNVNSRVRVADVFVGTVRSIELKNWVATLTLRIQKGVQLPTNATAKIGQTSLLGSQHVELATPPNPSPQLLKDGDTIPLNNSSAYPTTERTLATIATVLHGGGIPNLDVIQNEVYNMLTGRADQFRDFLGKLDTFITQLNQQREDITRAIDSTDRLLAYVGPRSNPGSGADRNPAADQAFRRHPRPVHQCGRIDGPTRRVKPIRRCPLRARILHSDLQLLQRPLKQLGRAAPYVVGALKVALSAPFPIDNVHKGDPRRLHQPVADIST